MLNSIVHAAFQLYDVLRFDSTVIINVSINISSPKFRRATRGRGIWPPPEILKTLHSNFDICRNFQRIKMNFYIPIILKKSSWTFSLSYW